MQNTKQPFTKGSRLGKKSLGVSSVLNWIHSS